MGYSVLYTTKSRIKGNRIRDKIARLREGRKVITKDFHTRREAEGFRGRIKRSTKYEYVALGTHGNPDYMKRKRRR